MDFIKGNIIKELRIKNNMTQKDLASELGVSDKTISKWETQKGLPDIGMIEDLAKALKVSITELFTGNVISNENLSANMRKVSFYVCPVCGNVISAIGEGNYSCHGILLPKAEVEELDEAHAIHIEEIDGEYYVTMQHDMTKKHSVSFFAYVTSNVFQMIKLYPEQMAESRFMKRGHGIVYGYCNRHGLFMARI